jgi:hypothetical protein
MRRRASTVLGRLILKKDVMKNPHAVEQVRDGKVPGDNNVVHAILRLV